MCRRLRSRMLCGVLAAALVPRVAFAAQEQPGAVELHGRADEQIQRARAQADPAVASRHYAEAAALYARVAAQIPETAADRGVRDELLSKVVNSALEAQRLDASNRQALEDALSVVRRHLDDFEVAYGVEARALPEYKDAERRLTLLRARLVTAPSPGPPSASTPPPSSDPVEVRATAPELKPVAPSVSVANPAPPGPAAHEDARPMVGSSPPLRPDRRWGGVKIAFVTSTVLTGATLGAALGTGLSVVRKPFTGAAYREIYEAATASGVPHDARTDMCLAGRQMALDELVGACDRRDALARTAVAMTSLTAIFAVTSVMFGVLLTRTKRAPRHALALSLSLSPDTAVAAATGRF